MLREWTKGGYALGEDSVGMPEPEEKRDTVGGASPREAYAGPKFTRRRMLLLAGGATGALFAWRFLPPVKGGEFPGLSYLTQNQARLLASVYAVIAPETTEEQTREAVLFLDGFISRLDKDQRLQLAAAFIILEHTPLLFHGYFPRFSRLPRDKQAHCIEGWRSGGVTRRPLYSALKELVYMAHYSHEWSWEAIGYSGPVVPPRPPAGPRDDFYNSLLAAENEP